MKIRCFLILFFFVFIVKGQETYQKKLEFLYEKVVRTQYSQLDSMKFYLNKIEENIKPKDSVWLAKYHSILGIYYQQNSKYDSAKYQQQKALDLGLAIKDSALLAKGNQRMGVIHKYLGNFDVAMDFFFKARDISYALKDTLTGATGDITISQTYWYIKDYQNGLKSIDRAILNGRKAKLINEIVSPAYIEKGNMYMLLGKLDSSLVYYKKAEKIVEKTPQKEGLAAIYSNIGGVNFYKNNLNEAIKYYKKGIQLAEDFKDQISFGISKMNLGEAYYTLNRFREAETELNESLDLFKKLNSKMNLVHNYNYLYELETRRKNYPKALDYYKLKTIYKDSILNERNIAKISNLEVKFQTAEKEKQITAQNLKLQTQKATIASQRNTQLLLIAGLGFLVLGSLLFYSNNKAKQKEALQKAVLNEKEKGFATVIKASEDERNRISKDLHDGIGQEMAALKMSISYLKDNETDEVKKQQIEKILNNCARSANEIRVISHQMMPRSLMENGLLEAIEYLLHSTFKLSDIKYNFEHFNINERFD
ncbi:tetratricopeptide repeat-containing sensor histidine kinase [uncultured Polaribacter sp.]|uniref:tetratricopeptide repeat-containing sensor histidine kinase n=1 Tax=uncultured Polaribacter sp. TaxID=174711 RepID=UPI0026309BC1|nr:tetratricopeptide repeat-containing sensor histidine kinase [uncultured Polaribacter sp.]